MAYLVWEALNSDRAVGVQAFAGYDRPPMSFSGDASQAPSPQGAPHAPTTTPAPAPAHAVGPARARAVPPWVKATALASSALVVVGYWPHYGPANFLWFSNLALFLLTLGLALERPLLVSMPAVGVFLLETGWTADLVIRLATGGRAFGITDYLFDPAYPAWVRAITLYHAALPPALWWATGRLGYDRRALAAWLGVAAASAGVALAFTDPSRNINWLWGLGADPPTRLVRPAYLLAWAAVLVLGFWWPTHRLLGWARPPAPRELARQPAGRFAAAARQS